MGNVSEEDAQQIAVDFVKKEKKQEGIAVSYVEQEGSVWIVQGTCPIDLEGHPWTEKFKVVVDQKGKITSTYFSLL
jgi:hypothetical protein